MNIYYIIGLVLLIFVVLSMLKDNKLIEWIDEEKPTPTPTPTPPVPTPTPPVPMPEPVAEKSPVEKAYEAVKAAYILEIKAAVDSYNFDVARDLMARCESELSREETEPAPAPVVDEKEKETGDEV